MFVIFADEQQIRIEKNCFPPFEPGRKLCSIKTYWFHVVYLGFFPLYSSVGDPSLFFVVRAGPVYSENQVLQARLIWLHISSRSNRKCRELARVPGRRGALEPPFSCMYTFASQLAKLSHAVLFMRVLAGSSEMGPVTRSAGAA